MTGKFIVILLFVAVGSAVVLTEVFAAGICMDRTDVPPFRHLYELEDSVRQLPSTGTISATFRGIASGPTDMPTTLDFFLDERSNRFAIRIVVSDLADPLSDTVWSGSTSFPPPTTFTLPCRGFFCPVNGQSTFADLRICTGLDRISPY
jgi:hypothetical protein